MKLLKHYRLSESEYKKICDLLGRPPRGVEWALFSALWSEHCSYKSSKIHLKKFAKTLTARVVNAAGENAGVVDLGHGERVVFKMESHNHPSFIEPYQGAATGVGGILRDIFTMGARPIALADYLCFGNIMADRMPTLVDGVVRGISGYGNSVGVPTVTGQTNFDSSYNQNILVNAMAVGLLRPGQSVALSGAKGVGNFVVYVGAKTGRDGVHGAAMASESFDDNSEAKKPNVQIGDPYFEKLLIESCLEVLQKNLVVAIQDMGAAGMTSSSFEMASKGGVGMRIHLDQVPLRDSSISPEEILLSESQERMLLVCEPEKFQEIQSIFSRWGLDAVQIGQILPEKKVELWWRDECLTSIDPDLLVEQAPVYERPFVKWQPHCQLKTREQLRRQPFALTTAISEYMESVHGAARVPIFRQYDQRVGLLTARGADHDVAFQQLPDSGRGLAIAVGCRPFVMRMDARLGGLDSVIYPTLQMAIKGAQVVAVTDCLNFGNPERFEIMSEFVAAVEAIAEASKAFEAPVVSGNVSFYNETLGQNITSTPATGLVGLRSSVQALPEDRFVESGNPVYKIDCAGIFANGLWAHMNNQKLQWAGEIHLPLLVEFSHKLQELSRSSGVLSTQMVGRGGLSLTLAMMCLSGVGFKLKESMTFEDLTQDIFYSSVFEIKSSSRVLFELELKKHGLAVELIGETQSTSLELGPGQTILVSNLQIRSETGLRRNIESLA